jgi:ribosomal protein S6
MRNYECLMIINPALSDTDAQSLLSEVRAEFTAHNATITQEEDWGSKLMSYKIHGSDTGHYILFTLASEGQGFFDVINSLNLKKDIWRNMITRVEV